MTTNQLYYLNKNLTPIDISSPKELETNDTIRNQLVEFFYKLKHNYDNYEKGLQICPVKITWNITNPNINGVLNFNKDDFIQGVLSIRLYRYMYMSTYLTDYVQYTIEAFKFDNLFKKQSYRYFKGKKCCDNQKILNYNKYYFMQDIKYIGNR